jgi:hypothetical protein
MEIPLDFVNSQETAYEVKEAARRSGVGNLVPLPFNRYEPEATQWWLSPSTDNPAYKHGKIVFEQRQPARLGHLFVGLYVEKGVGPTAAEMFRTPAHSRRSIMDESWVWHGFLEDLAGTAFRDAAEEAIAKARHPLTIAVEAMYVEPPSEDRDIHAHGYDAAWSVFRLDGDGLAFDRENSTPKQLLGDVPACRQLPQLAEAIQAGEQLDWMWVDFLVGFRFMRGAAGESDWDAARLWMAAGSPWLKWLR